VHNLEKVYRTDNVVFLKFLNMIREGKVSYQNLTNFNNRFVMTEQYFLDNVLPEGKEYTVLCTTNDEVKKINDFKLSQLDTVGKTFYMDTEGEVQRSDMIVEEELFLKIGARVMIRVNGDNYVNGSLGVITGLPSYHNNNVEVEIDGHVYSIGRHKWEIYDANGEVEGVYSQYPLNISYSISCHKSQGLGFEYMLINPGRGFFASGQLYTALSRSSNPAGLGLLKEIKLNDVKVDYSALKWVLENTKKL
jgi:ATP-dependent exoDNAse (exonuclease V) alpha subunit